MSEEELKAFRNLNTFSTKYIVNKKASSKNDITTMFVYIAKLEVELEHKDKEIERLNNIIEDFEEELEREVNIKEEDTGLEHNTYIDINTTLKSVLKRFRKLKGESNE